MEVINADIRIQLAKDNYGYPEYHFKNSTDILDYFDTHQEYRQGKDLYWHCQSIYNYSPMSKTFPPLHQEDLQLWYKFHNLMFREFTNEKNY